ncbi:MAG TPA: efflux RND transporter periplasmic adaptor subunit [Planctomycetaceae bacterium]
MADTETGRSQSPDGSQPGPVGTASPGHSGSVATNPASPAGQGPAPMAAPANGPVPAATPGNSDVAAPRQRAGRRWILLGAAVVALAAMGYYLTPWIETMLNTVSTDDAYVNGHVTFVAPRVAGQVSRVLVDDNVRVKRGALLVQLDKEPHRVQVSIKQAAVGTAESDVAAAQAQVRGLVAQARSNRFKLDHAMEDVRNQIELLRSNKAQLKVEDANRDLAERDYARAESLVGKGAVSQQQFDQAKAALQVAQNRVTSAEQTIQQTRASLGLPINHNDPLDVPKDLEQNFSSVRAALGAVYNSVAQLGFTPKTWDATPKQAIEEFYNQDPEKNLDRIFERLISESPAVKQAEARLLQVRHDLELAELNLRYCDVLSEIDGVVTSRNVNPGNNVSAGQNLMAVRSLTEIWIDANFKETQLAELRIGQRVRCEVDMYGKRREYEGRITGFTMGTGQTLSLLPPQNATGNFVKIVQRLPVRVELTNYDPDKAPLFVGLSVEPFVYIKDKPEGPHAGDMLQPVTELPLRTPASEAVEEETAIPAKGSAGAP